MRWRIRRNSPSLRLNPASTNVEYIIYAKEFNRVRFEVRYKSNLRETLRLNAERNLDRQVTGIATLVEPAIQNAQRRLRRLFSHMPDLDYSEHCDFNAFINFLAAISDACAEAGIPDNARSMIALFCSNGRYEARLNSPEHQFCENLVRQRILSRPKVSRNKKGYRIYALQAPYSNVLRGIISEFDRAA